MLRPVSGSEGRARVSSLLRVSGLVVGILLGAAGIWVLITADTTKDTRIGAVVSAWGIFFALSALFGRSRHHDAQPAGGELVVRSMTGLDTLSDARAAREYEQRLQAMLRHEIQQTLGAELAALRAEVSSLRSEVVEKVGGELRLERIETTRIIGSDIEALQREIRQLKTGRFADDEPDRPRPIPTTVDATVLDAAVVVDAVANEAPAWPSQAPPAPAPFIPPAPAPARAPEPVPQAELTMPVPALRDVAPPEDAPAPAGGSFWQSETKLTAPWSTQTPYAPATDAAPEAPTPAPVSTPAAAPAPSPAPAPVPQPDPNDPFASLPRIRPFTDFDLDPVDAPSTPVEPAAAGGRRRRADDDDDGVLSRILQRERGN